MRCHQIVFVALAGLLAIPCSATAQHLTPHDSLEAVVAALTYARQNLLGSHKHYLLDVAHVDRSMRWDSARAEALRRALPSGAAARGTPRVCDSARRSCRLDDSTEVISVSRPTAVADSLIVQVAVQRPTSVARIPVTLRGYEYVLLKRGSRWVVVRSDLVSVS
jgi:hypothetical protein